MNNQQEQEERQQKILEALRRVEHCINVASVMSIKDLTEKDIEALDFLASECGVGEQWRKRNGD